MVLKKSCGRSLSMVCVCVVGIINDDEDIGNGGRLRHRRDYMMKTTTTIIIIIIIVENDYVFCLCVCVCDQTLIGIIFFIEKCDMTKKTMMMIDDNCRVVDYFLSFKYIPSYDRNISPVFFCKIQGVLEMRK